MHYQDIIFQVDDPVAVIKFNRPEALNAFTRRMLAEIRHALAAAEQDENCLLYTSPSPRDVEESRMPSSA